MFQTKFRPDQIHPTVFIAPGAVVVGDVSLAEEVSIWFNATLRGDTTPIRVGAGSNIQEGCILHADPGFPAIISTGVTVGHGAVIHGAKIGQNTLIGIRSVLLNGVEVGENCIVGASSLLTQGKVFPAGSLIMGAPAQVIRPLTSEEIERNRMAAVEYIKRSRAFMASYNH